MTHVRSHQAIHQSLREEGNQHKPFGGKQVILLGELLQLPPVPDDLDEGMFMFYSPLFGSAITHRFKLTEIMWQFDKDFLSALQDVRVSKCSNDAQFSEHAYEQSRRFGKGSTAHLLFTIIVNPYWNFLNRSLFLTLYMLMKQEG